LLFHTLSNIFTLMQGKRNVLACLYTLVVLSVVLESIGIGLIYPVVDIIQDADQLTFYRNKFSPWIPQVNELSPEKFLNYLIVGTALLFITKNFLMLLVGYYNMKVVSGLYCSWVNKISKIYLNMPYSFFLDSKTGDLVQRKILQTQKSSDAIRQFILLLGNVTAILGIVIVIYYMSPKVSLILAGITIPIYYISMKFSKRFAHKRGKRSVELEQIGFNITSEAILGIKQVKIFCREIYFQERMKEVWDEYAQNECMLRFLSIAPRPTLETLLVFFLLVFILFLNTPRGFDENIMPMFALIFAGIFRIIPLASASSSLSMGIASYLPSVEIVASLLRTKSEQNKGVPFSTFKNEIEFKNISFGYKDLDFVLRDLSLKFKAKNFYGIVGPTGSGKSTIADILAGFFTPQKGKVLVDGINLNDININSWLYKLGVVSQDSFVFSGTIEDNICFGIKAENRDQDKIKQAAKVSQLSEFIEQLPMGYQTSVGERGVDLSGGQRQRLVIARAMYLDLPILIFDEATSSLDSITTKKIKNIFESSRNKKTIIVIAHNISTIASADWIYVLDNGVLAEEGTHNNLIHNKNIYSRLFSEQNLR
jgi:ATP-binding cassette, subfamily B, bacterial PglK